MDIFDASLFDSLWIGLIVGLASFVQSLTGFGFALVAVSLLPFFMDLQLAITLVLLVNLVCNLTLWWYHRDNFEWSRIIHLVGAGFLTIPIGVLGLHHIPEHLALQLLGALVLIYVIYSSLQLSPPELEGRRWAYAFGAASGVLTGAFNTGGPPIVIYGNCREWSPEQFKSHLPGTFAVMSVVAIATHVSQGHFDKMLLSQVGYATPFFLSGLGLGIWLSNYINAAQFRQVIMVLLSVVGLKLVF
ncbi:sulfite exporter TauE/SafE family protein [Leptothoe kymatousa]|uniref:Probable membrane transporter protein n=1 Tax=Leptothoe kymatousa TAU-MAC 1615 TaxID=2364775 RepID=A0ABS5Y654_9CYAN|nr:sulfite exporter TauE/SafE family protein [Leptothoe kymatousa]MBT9313251.1 sulfite exporter TauE/SafE family protein [Leptothoe kymatousa TAU-MAC 1615]